MKSSKLSQAEYIWLDGATPVQKLRSKTRIVAVETGSQTNPKSFPEWGFDGSSTYQATGHDSDLILNPVFSTVDPLRGEGNYLVLCEVMNSDGTPHATNQRAELREFLAAGGNTEEPLMGFEQEYTFFKGRSPLGWPQEGFPSPQGPFYCSVGADVAFGRDIVEEHTQACLDAELLVYGTNAEVMPGQWEFQIGYRGFSGETADPLTCSDHLWVGRWLLNRIAEDFNVTVSFDCKPVKGDWNGAGMHTNFSTKSMRDRSTGLAAIDKAVDYLREKHTEHIASYGFGLEDRLTGHHETCSIHEFRHGVANRGASIRIPRHVASSGAGYLEDRRPGANADPYRVATLLMKTICSAR
jgi:glutamine synthetase